MLIVLIDSLKYEVFFLLESHSEKCELDGRVPCITEAQRDMSRAVVPDRTWLSSCLHCWSLVVSEAKTKGRGPRAKGVAW